MTITIDQKNRLKSLKKRIHEELYDSVIPFWLRHSIDRERGGYYNCLDRDGSIWDTRKHVWLQGRELWMLSALYNSTMPHAEVLDAARLGAEFLTKHARRPDNRVYFCLNREGQPVSLQRKIFSECFYVMGMAEYARATGDDKYRLEARTLLASVIEFAKDLTFVGRPAFAGGTRMTSLAIPMILLNLADIVEEEGEEHYVELKKWCVEQMQLHIRPELSLVLEHVAPDGALLDTPEGRVVNPGHAIEAGWFLLDHAIKNNRADLVQDSLKMIEWSIDYGWDKEYGGLFYYLDRAGYSPPALEWPMKLWWPHNELMVACTMAFQQTHDEKWLRELERACDYTLSLFPDPEYGEWFGYFDRMGNRTHRFKGGAYKGCFHVPRALWLCDEMMARMATE